jgi:hypothetical protein
MREQLQYGTSKIEYALAFARRKTLGIKVYPNQSVEVIAPLESTAGQVKEKLKRKASWILKQQAFFLSFYPLTPPRQYVSGETHLYLGKQYRLKLHLSKEESVKLHGGYFHVCLKDRSNKKKVEQLLKGWYKDKAVEHFQALYEKSSKIADAFKQKPTLLKYRWMARRWGSCSSKGSILLNLELIKAPKSCIEYVLIHELCHLEHHNHSKAFYALLERYCPEWREVKQRLEEMLS